MAKRKTKPAVFIVSDGRGETASLVLRAAAVQFGDARYRLVLKPDVRTPRQVDQAVEAASRANAAIFYTLVSEDTRSAMKEASGRRLVPAVDILGPAFGALHDLFQSERGSTPGLLYDSEKERIDRMEAIDYTLKHDDGQRPHELRDADVVLVGVSRASKSSTCFFLAYQGMRAANVPLVPGVPPPSQLLELARDKVVGLRVNVNRLLTVRGARAENLRLGSSDPYVDRRAVAREVVTANRSMERHGWRSIDASYLAIEEISREVARLRGWKLRGQW